MMNTIINFAAKSLTVLGKEVSKKALIIGGSAAGVAVAGGVTAGVVVHNKKKTTEGSEENAKETIKDQASDNTEKKNKAAEIINGWKEKLAEKKAEREAKKNEVKEDAEEEAKAEAEHPTDDAPEENITEQPIININPFQNQQPQAPQFGNYYYDAPQPNPAFRVIHEMQQQAAMEAAAAKVDEVAETTDVEQQPEQKITAADVATGNASKKLEKKEPVKKQEAPKKEAVKKPENKQPEKKVDTKATAAKTTKHKTIEMPTK